MSSSSARPRASSDGVSARMKVQRRRDTEPELAVRRLLHAAGFRYRVDYRPIAGVRRTADIAFPARHVAVFIDGCFWHSCPQHATSPRANSEWWAAKLRRNVDRDRATDERLRGEGWLVLRFWEHERPEDVAAVVSAEVAARGGVRLRPNRAD